MNFQNEQAEYMQNKIMMDMVNQVQKGCFNDCVNNFKSGDLDQQEVACIRNCTSRFFGMNAIMSNVAQSLHDKGGAGF